MNAEDLAKHLSFFVPTGFLLMAQEELDRIHNESEARFIERNDARAEIERLREEIGQYKMGAVPAHEHGEKVAEVERLREALLDLLDRQNDYPADLSRDPAWAEAFARAWRVVGKD